MPEGQVLEFHRVTKRFGAVTAVSDLSVRVEPGAVTGFLGPNGAGKTTTLRMLLGQIRPSSGTATVGGVSYPELRNPLRTIGAVLEEVTYRPRRTAARQLLIAAKANGIPTERVDEVLRLVGLHADADTRIGGYSLGMRQRLSVATALLGDPGALVLDEPANGLDPEGIRWMRLLMRRLADEGRTVLVSSHVLSEIEQVADNVVVLSKGRAVYAGSIDDLADPSSGAVVVDAEDRAALVAALTAAGLSFDLLRSGVTVRNSDAAAVGAIAASAGIALTTLQQRSPSLEDVFLNLVYGRRSDSPRLDEVANPVAHAPLSETADDLSADAAVIAGGVALSGAASVIVDGSAVAAAGGTVDAGAATGQADAGGTGAEAEQADVEQGDTGQQDPLPADARAVDVDAHTHAGESDAGEQSDDDESDVARSDAEQSSAEANADVSETNSESPDPTQPEDAHNNPADDEQPAAAPDLAAENVPAGAIPAGAELGEVERGDAPPPRSDAAPLRSDLRGHSARSAEPETAEPEATEPEATEPEATEPETTEPETTEPEATESETTEPETTEPETTEPETTEPETTEPETTEPETTEPETTEPETTEPETTELETTDVTAPDAGDAQADGNSSGGFLEALRAVRLNLGETGDADANAGDVGGGATDADADADAGDNDDDDDDGATTTGMWAPRSAGAPASDSDEQHDADHHESLDRGDDSPGILPLATEAVSIPLTTDPTSFTELITGIPAAMPADSPYETAPTTEAISVFAPMLEADDDDDDSMVDDAEEDPRLAAMRTSLSSAASRFFDGPAPDYPYGKFSPDQQSDSDAPQDEGTMQAEAEQADAQHHEDHEDHEDHEGHEHVQGEHDNPEHSHQDDGNHDHDHDEHRHG